MGYQVKKQGQTSLKASVLRVFPKNGKSTVTAELLAGFGDDFKEMVTYLLAFSCECALFTYTPDTKVIVRRDGKQIAKICKNILGDKKGSKTYHGILMETEN